MSGERLDQVHMLVDVGTWPAGDVSLAVREGLSNQEPTVSPAPVPGGWGIDIGVIVQASTRRQAIAATMRAMKDVVHAAVMTCYLVKTWVTMVEEASAPAQGTSGLRGGER